jgi:hypothetical protein
MHRIVRLSALPLVSILAAIGCSSPEERSEGETVSQAWAVADESPLRVHGAERYTLERDRDGQGFSLRVWSGESEPLDVVRVQFAEGRLRAAIDAIPNAFAEWDEARGWHGDVDLLPEIEHYLAGATLDAALTVLALGDEAPAAEPVLGARAGLIDRGAGGPLLEGEPLTCPTGLVQALASVGALVAEGSERSTSQEGDLPSTEPGDGVAIASAGGAGDSNGGALLAAANRGVSSDANARACGDREVLLAQAPGGQSCWLRDLQRGANAFGVFALGATAVCVKGTMVTTLGTLTKLCLVPAGGVALSAITSAIAGGSAELTCGNNTRRVAPAALPAGRWNASDYVAVGVDPREAQKLAAAGKCSPQEYIRRRADVHHPNACDGPRRCSDNPPGKKATPEWCQQVRENIRRGRECRRRRDIRDFCFGGPDPTHQGQNKQVQDAIDKCVTAAKKWCPN